MNDKELADKVVALGVVELNQMTHNYFMGDVSLGRSDYKLVRDWRVAGALLEAKAWGCNLIRKGDEWEAHVVPIGQIKEYIARNESGPRAITEACGRL